MLLRQLGFGGEGGALVAAGDDRPAKRVEQAVRQIAPQVRLGECEGAYHPFLQKRP